MQGKSNSIKDKIFGKILEFIEETKSEDEVSFFYIRSIIFGLFALVGFMIVVYQYL